MAEQVEMPFGYDPVPQKKKPPTISRKEILAAMGHLEKTDQRSEESRGWYSVEMLSQVIGKTVTKAKMRWLDVEGYVFMQAGENMNAGKYRLGKFGHDCLKGRRPFPKG